MKKNILLLFLLGITTYSFGQMGCNGLILESITPLNDSLIQVDYTTPDGACGYAHGDGNVFKFRNTIKSSLQNNVTIFSNGLDYPQPANNNTRTIGYADQTNDSLGLSDTSLIPFIIPFGSDTVWVRDPNRMIKTIDFTLDKDSNYHIIALGYYAGNDYRSTCNPAPTDTQRLLHIKATHAISNQLIYSGLVPGKFTQYDVLETAHTIPYYEDIRIIATTTGLIQTRIIRDSLQVSYFDNSYQLLHAQSVYLKAPEDSEAFYTFNKMYAIGTYYYQYLTFKKWNENTLTYDNYMLVYKFDHDGHFMERKKLTAAYEVDNWTSEYTGKHVFYYPADSSHTIAKLTDTQGDTVHTVVLPFSYRKTFYTNQHHFINITDTFYLRDGIYGNFIPTIQEYDSTGRFLYAYSIPELFKRYSFAYLYSFTDWDYFVDKFDHLNFEFRSDDRLGCPHNNSSAYRSTMYVLPLNYKYRITGTVINDINRNCQRDSNENVLKNILVELQFKNRTYYTLSNDSGKYYFTAADTGRGKVMVHLQNQTAFVNACSDTVSFSISDTIANPVVDFFLHTPFCNHPVPKVTVDISTPFLRRCFDNLYTLTITNESNDTAYNTYADVFLDSNLIPADTAFASAENLGNYTYRFHFGTLAPLETIRRNLMVNVDCNTTVLGQTHCVKAVSYPYETCLVGDMPYMQAYAACRNDSVIFTVKDMGYQQLMDNFYRVIVNDTVNYQGYLHFTTGNSTQTLSYYNPEGKTFHLETIQFPAYPNEDSVLSVSIEGCGNSNFSTGYITMYPQDDDQPNVSIDCHQNAGSYDPNDKSAAPLGYNDAHLIENTQAIEYTIHFQNTGTYSAFTVTILDTLSPAADMGTLQIISASHNYTYTIIDSGILQFRFDYIYLPAQSSDSLLSNGFIKFSVRPKKHTAIGTLIRNNAFITFDSNTPVKTNTVQHEIGKDFLGVNLISAVKNHSQHDLHTKVYPNPFNQTATLTFDYNQPTQLSILSLDGRIVQQLSTINNFYIINRNKLSSGTYIYELRNSNTKELLDTGKLIIQ